MKTSSWRIRKQNCWGNEAEAGKGFFEMHGHEFTVIPLIRSAFFSCKVQQHRCRIQRRSRRNVRFNHGLDFFIGSMWKKRGILSFLDAIASYTEISQKVLSSNCKEVGGEKFGFAVTYCCSTQTKLLFSN